MKFLNMNKQYLRAGGGWWSDSSGRVSEFKHEALSSNPGTTQSKTKQKTVSKIKNSFEDRGRRIRSSSQVGL
jgi:hypothetical protein